MIIQIPVNVLDKNFSYLIIDENTSYAVVVDPGDIQTLYSRAKELEVEIKAVLISHSHFDHVQAVKKLCTSLDIPIYMHKLAYGKFDIDNVDFFLLEDADVFKFYDVNIECIYTPGHLDDCMCYLVDKRDLITGDTLFVEGCGRADFESSNVHDLYISLQKLKKLEDSTRVLPGHDYGSTTISTIKHEKEHNRYLLCSDFESFRKLRMK